MAKKKRVPLNRLVEQETFDTVKVLAEVLECSEGEVVDQAVTLLESSLSGGEGLQRTERVIVPEVVEPTVGERQTNGLESLVASIPGVQVGVVTLPKNATCAHCGQKFAGPKFASLCGGCRESGHEPKDVRECAGCWQPA